MKALVLCFWLVCIATTCSAAPYRGERGLRALRAVVSTRARRLSARLFPKFQNPPPSCKTSVNGYIANPEVHECQTYFYCRNGRAYPYKCPIYQKFSREKMRCEYSGVFDCTKELPPSPPPPPPPLYDSVEPIDDTYYAPPQLERPIKYVKDPKPTPTPAPSPVDPYPEPYSEPDDVDNDSNQEPFPPENASSEEYKPEEIPEPLEVAVDTEPYDEDQSDLEFRDKSHHHQQRKDATQFYNEQRDLVKNTNGEMEIQDPADTNDDDGQLFGEDEQDRLQEEPLSIAEEVNLAIDKNDERQLTQPKEPGQVYSSDPDETRETPNGGTDESQNPGMIEDDNDDDDEPAMVSPVDETEQPEPYDEVDEEIPDGDNLPNNYEERPHHSHKVGAEEIEKPPESTVQDDDIDDEGELRQQQVGEPYREEQSEADQNNDGDDDDLEGSVLPDGEGERGEERLSQYQGNKDVDEPEGPAPEDFIEEPLPTENDDNDNDDDDDGDEIPEPSKGSYEKPIENDVDNQEGNLDREDDDDNEQTDPLTDEEGYAGSETGVEEPLIYEKKPNFEEEEE